MNKLRLYTVLKIANPALSLKNEVAILSGLIALLLFMYNNKNGKPAACN